MIDKWKVKGTTMLVAVTISAGLSFLYGGVKGRLYADRDTIRSLEKALERNDQLERKITANEKSTQADLEVVLADADSARIHASRLFDELSRCESNASTINDGSTTNQAEGVRTNVLNEIEVRLTTLAQYADESRIAGLACETQYNTVKDTP